MLFEMLLLIIVVCIFGGVLAVGDAVFDVLARRRFGLGRRSAEKVHRLRNRKRGFFKMMYSEFYERTGVTVDGDEFLRIQEIYNDSRVLDKDEFCLMWLRWHRNGDWSSTIQQMQIKIDKLECQCKKMHQTLQKVADLLD